MEAYIVYYMLLYYMREANIDILPYYDMKEANIDYYILQYYDMKGGHIDYILPLYVMKKAKF